MHTKNVFFALMSRMQNIQRWSKSNPTRAENVAEHSLQVAMIAHCLGMLRNTMFTHLPQVDADHLAVLALYHDGPEVLTEDVNSLIKYSDKRFLQLCREMESIACEMMINTLPEALREAYATVLDQHGRQDDSERFVKAADLLSAYTKALSELRSNNAEFRGTKQKLDKALAEYRKTMPEVDYFMEQLMPAFMLTIDELVDTAFMNTQEQGRLL